MIGFGMTKLNVIFAIFPYLVNVWGYFVWLVVDWMVDKQNTDTMNGTQLYQYGSEKISKIS